MKVAIVVGTRPEIIKMSPVIKACQARGIDFRIIHTNQHYSENMSGAFFKDLQLPLPHYSLNTITGTPGKLIGSMLGEFETVFNAEQFDMVCVQGDTSTVVAAAMIASQQHIPVAHIEAGLRSRDRTMPEEINRLVVDQISDYLFAPSQESLVNLLNEGISKERAWNTGNTVVDATLQGIDLARASAKQTFLPTDEYLLLTLHRPANVDDPHVLNEIMSGIGRVSTLLQLPIIFPVHHRTRKQFEQGTVKAPRGLHLVDPTGYLDFLNLQSQSKLILTDSGGVQEEACIVHVPCVTIRNNTERPETVAVGANTLAGITKEGIVQAAEKMMKASRNWLIPYGDGTSGQQIVDKLAAACAS